MTLTSDVMLPPNVSGKNQAQRWLDDLPLSKEIDLDIRLGSLVVGSQYFKKLTLSVNKGPLETFGAHVRSIAVEKGDMAAAASWAKAWEPHVSLMYADIEITVEKRQEILQVVTEAGILIEKEHVSIKYGEDNYNGWKGARIALVDTWKELGNWNVIASRAI